MEELIDVVHDPDLTVAGDNGSALAGSHFAVGMPALAGPVQNALFARRPDLFAIQCESSVTIAGLGAAISDLIISPPGSIPAAQRGPAPGEYPDRATVRD